MFSGKIGFTLINSNIKERIHLNHNCKFSSKFGTFYYTKHLISEENTQWFIIYYLQIFLFSWARCTEYLLSTTLYYTGSDIYVSIDLYIRCHYFYALCVLAFVLLPGFIFGWYHWTKKGNFLKALVSTIWFIPYSFWKYWMAIKVETGEITEHDNDMKL